MSSFCLAWTTFVPGRPKLVPASIATLLIGLPNVWAAIHREALPWRYRRCEVMT